MSVSGTTISSIAGALGTLIGYIGAEAATVTVFDSLLWPQRYYNKPSVKSILFCIILGGMGGPVHKAALDVLDRFREHGLYGGMQEGHMLGTAFYQDSAATYKIRSAGKGSDIGTKEARNCLWYNVLRQLRYCRGKAIVTPKSCPDREDSEKAQPSTLVRRTSIPVQHLRLCCGPFCGEDVVSFSESPTALWSILGILASEAVCFACMAVVLHLHGINWFAVYFAWPCLLKLFALGVSVRRETCVVDHPKAADEPTTLVEFTGHKYGCLLIEGPNSLIMPFFRHWGHPVRKTRMDRVREVASIAIIYAFVLQFPVGLLSMLWVNQDVQMAWLAYQLYLIICMHVVRFAGVSNPGKLENEIAEALGAGKVVKLSSENQISIYAKLETHIVGRVADNRLKVTELVQRHRQELEIQRMSKKDILQSSP